MENKKGFISTALVYSFLVIYLFLMLSIINMYLSKTTYLEALDEQVAVDIGITKETRKTLFNLLLENNVALETNLIEFGKVSNGSIKNGNGLFYVDESNLAQNEAKVTDENHDGFGKKIFFFRGDVKNNYVVFGKVFKRKDDNVIDGSSVKEICWRILRTNENGKPIVEGICFNLSHSGDYVICAVSERPVGCDIEQIKEENRVIISF